MKALNIILGSLALGLGGATLICILADQFLSKDMAMVVAAPPIILLGMMSRRIVEKFMGYTLYEALQEGSKDE